MVCRRDVWWFLFEELTGRRSNEFEEDLSRILMVIELVNLY